MSNIANSPDVLAAIQQRKRSIKKKLQASRTQMTDNVSYLTGGNIPKTTDRVQKIQRHSAKPKAPSPSKWTK